MKEFYDECIACIDVLYRVTGFCGGSVEASERISNVSI